MRAEEHDDAADCLDVMHTVEAGGERFSRRGRGHRSGFLHSYLEKLAGIERLLHRTDDGVGDPFLADLGDRLQVVRE